MTLLRVRVQVIALVVCLAAPVSASTWIVPTEVSDLAAALAMCAAGDTVMVEDGTYVGPANRDLTMPQLNLVLRSRNGPDACTIDCEGQGQWVHVFDSDVPHSILIDGFRVIHARHAVYAVYSSLTIRNCLFEDNGAGTGAGGALMAFGPKLVVENCRFRGNDVGVGGQGGAAWVGFGEATFVRCLFEHNHAGYGGAIYGGATGTLQLENCTLAGNVAEQEAGGIHYGSGDLILKQTIVYGNHSILDRADEIDALNQSHEPECCDLRREGIHGPDWTFEDSIDADPQFCDAASWEHPEYASDYRLRGDSPCLARFSPCGVPIGVLDEGCSAPQPVGACCIETACTILTKSECANAGGGYVGDDAGCFPDPCIPVPTRVVSWGQIKAQFRPGAGGGR